MFKNDVWTKEVAEIIKRMDDDLSDIPSPSFTDEEIAQYEAASRRIEEVSWALAQGRAIDKPGAKQ